MYKSSYSVLDFYQIIATIFLKHNALQQNEKLNITIAAMKKYDYIVCREIQRGIKPHLPN